MVYRLVDGKGKAVNLRTLDGAELDRLHYFVEDKLNSIEFYMEKHSKGEYFG
jgi:hypothetical protein